MTPSRKSGSPMGRPMPRYAAVLPFVVVLCSVSGVAVITLALVGVLR